MAEITDVEAVSSPILDFSENPVVGVDPRLVSQTGIEDIGDPLLRQLYFGTADSPGFFDQVQSVGQNISSMLPAGLGMYLPFLERAQLLSALEASPVTAADIGQFYDPFEDMVVQQTIDDVLKQAAIEDNIARAQAIGQAGEGAFGSRGRLQASERAEAIGRGLGAVLPEIRSRGFSDALSNVFNQRSLFGRGADFSSDLATLAPSLFERDAFRQLALLQGIGSLLPGYSPTTSRIQSEYGIPPDPTALGLGAGLGFFNLFRQKDYDPRLNPETYIYEKQKEPEKPMDYVGDVLKAAFGNRENTGTGFGFFGSKPTDSGESGTGLGSIFPSSSIDTVFNIAKPKSSSANPFAGGSFNYSPFGGGFG